MYIKFLKKIFNKEILVIVLFGLCLFGFIKYVDYRFDLLSIHLENNNEILVKENDELKNDFEKEIKRLEDFVFGTQTTLTDVIEQEKEKSSLLEDQFNEITNTVGVLSKLSTTDKELLKKYSKVYFLNEHYVPISITDIPFEYRSVKSTRFQVHSNIITYLEDMITDSNEDGLSIRALSAYRSFAEQTNLKDAYKVTYGSGANKFSADQGYSEHQLGTTVDFTTIKTDPNLNGFDKTPEYKWMQENAHKYGFILSYPSGNIYYKFEPWHWRFVGVDLATRLHNDNVNFYDMDQRIIDSYLANIFD